MVILFPGSEFRLGILTLVSEVSNRLDESLRGMMFIPGSGSIPTLKRCRSQVIAVFNALVLYSAAVGVGALE